MMLWMGIICGGEYVNCVKLMVGSPYDVWIHSGEMDEICKYFH